MFQNASVPLMQDAQGFLQIAIADSHKHSEIRVPLDHAEKRARTDVLTEPPNRLAFEDFFCNAQMAAVENRRPLSVLLIDVDHFKRLGLQEVVWVFLATSEGWKHACEHLEPQIFLVA
jgi:predicted signal transduction protein with EAL and GGDEF domain